MLALTGTGLAQRPVTGDAPRLAPILESVSGRDTYNFYCVGCHGPTGRGDGPVAPTLKTKVPDLTTLARRNGGAFPLDRVRAAVVNTERPVTAHGTGDMPVWGTIFRYLDRTDTISNVRIDQVAGFIATLQDPPLVSALGGGQLFAAYCAACHGSDGRGGGPLSTSLRREPPDLTLFATRNGNVFPEQRVRQMISGVDMAAHGTREMPVWGDAFKRTSGGLTDAAVAARIEALAAYLSTIQQRNGE